MEGIAVEAAQPGQPEEPGRIPEPNPFGANGRRPPVQAIEPCASVCQAGMYGARPDGFCP